MAQSEKRENSVLFSLRELRQIEESRVQEEEHAVRSAEEARRLAKEAAERKIREAEEAKIREERDHQRSIEEARVAAAIGLIFFAIQRKNAADEADRQAELDRKAKEEAVKVAADAQEKVERIQHDLDDLNDKITKAVDAVATAQNDADRASARQKLANLLKEQAEMRQRAADAKAAAAKAERARGVHTSAECLANPLAKGCS